jgi:hypothetical protein
MYYWLERETQTLREIADFSSFAQNKSDEHLQFLNSDNTVDESNCMSLDDTTISTTDQQPSLLHEQILKDQKMFQAKIQRLNKRRYWLRSNELLLRTFLSYCSLHSASGGGLNSVKMELLLLMLELIEDRSMKQLLLPVPVPTTIPILSACIASSKNVLAGPIQMLKSLVNDILSSIYGIHAVPNVFECPVVISTMKELSVSLSSCIYQCLCDSDSLIVSNSNVVTGMQGFSR